MIDRRRTGILILAVFEQDRLGVRMRTKETDQFLAAIAAKPNHARLIFIHRHE